MITKTFTDRYRDKLESTRMTTRFVTAEDIKPWSEFFKDRDSIRYIPFRSPDPLESATWWIERQLNRYKNSEFGLQALVLKETGELIGMSGLLLQDVEGTKETEIGYHLLKQHRGKGLAQEAALLFKEFAFSNNITSSVTSMIYVDNNASQNVAVKNGMLRERQLTWNDIPIYIYRITK